MNANKSTKENNTTRGKSTKRRLLTALFCALAFAVLFAAVLSDRGDRQVYGLEIPAKYGEGYGVENIKGLVKDEQYKGIICVDPAAKRFNLAFDTDNGLITLARISQNSSLEGYVFEINYGGLIVLEIVRDENGNVDEEKLDSSFFGIGNGNHPFKGTLEIGGGTDTAVAVKEGGWKYFFNNLSNQAAIKTKGNKLYSSYASGNTQEADMFMLCKTLTVTKNDNALIIDGFRFGSAEGTGNSGGRIQNDEKAAFFAGEIVAGGAKTFSVDLSDCFTSGNYYAESATADCAGLIAEIAAGVNATVTVPSALSVTAKSGGAQKNVGVLVGSNHGAITVTSKQNEKGVKSTLTATGTLDCSGSAGLIGANESDAGAKSSSTFDAPIAAVGLSVKGLRTAAIIGTCKGDVIFNENATVSGCTFEKTRSGTEGHLGGVIGSVDFENVGIELAENKTINVSDCTFNAYDVCNAGGFVGYLKTDGTASKNVAVSGATFNMNGSQSTCGGFVGLLSTTGDYTLTLTNEQTESTCRGLSLGVFGGAIGKVTGKNKKVTIQGVTGGSAIKNTVANGIAAKAGGVVGEIDESAFVKINDLIAENTIVNYVNRRCQYAGDAVGNAANGAALDLGNFTLTETKGSVLIGSTGKGTVVRLSGKINDNSASVYNLVYQQNASLIYKDTECVYTAGETARYNDIGNYGQIVRNDTLNILSLSEEGKVSVSNPLTAANNEITIASAADFAKYAITVHTKGTISGVTGIDSNNYGELLGKNIRFTASVSLVDTGIEQLTPSKEETEYYTGKVYGGENTVTLAIGQNISGVNDGVKNAASYANNERKRLGLFATTQNAIVENLKLDGNIKLQLYNLETYAGGLCAVAEGGLNVTDYETSVNIKLDGSVESFSQYVCAGGLVGKINNAVTLIVKNSVFGATIADNSAISNASYYSKRYFGGMCGLVNYTGTEKADFTGNSVEANISGTNGESLQAGGFIGAFVSSSYAEADFDKTTASGVQITAGTGTKQTGGLLGYNFVNCHVNNLNGKYVGTVTANGAVVGGLMHTLTGRMSVKGGFSLTGSAFNALDGNKCGMLLSDGKQALVSVECAADGFSGVSANGFDLFVGENVVSKGTTGIAESGGIVSVETTGDGVGKIPAESDWYALIAGRTNDKTRYYFNVMGLLGKEVPSNTVASAQDLYIVASAQDLLYWHLYDYAKDNFIDGVKNEYFRNVSAQFNNGFTATADVNLEGYCVYPTQKSSVTINFDNNTLTFAARENGYFGYAQFYGLQAGLLSDVTASVGDASVRLENVRLSGNLASLGNSKGSGALICGRVYGKKEGNEEHTVTLTVQNVALVGLKVLGKDYRPLLINNMASYVTAEIRDVTQEYADSEKSVACSLIGNGGITEQNGLPSTGIRVNLSNIILNGTTDGIFTKATLFYDVKYVNGAGSFVYNFTRDEDWGAEKRHAVTYGAELYYDEEQQKYYDVEIYVNPESAPDENSALYENFKNYLPYVFVGFVKGSDVESGDTNRNLSVNRKGADFIEGFGTYENPYVVRSVKQLVDLSKWLSGTQGFNDEWQINFPRGDWSEISKLDLTGCYVVQQIGGELKRMNGENGENVTLAKDLLLDYLAGAYYKIEGKGLTLTSDFVGLGSTTRPFHGVVYGVDESDKNVSITLASPKNAINEQGYGFINVANGCAVYGLDINYGELTVSKEALKATSAATSAPQATELKTELKTDMPHFGGAIAWIAGGDNLIKNVNVSIGNVANKGAAHAAFGYYVGLISGGGVLLSELGVINGNEDNDEAHIYFNNYVGRVLSGYALAVDGKTYNNGKSITIGGKQFKGDFPIPKIDKTEFSAQNSSYVSDGFRIGTARDLLALSLAINSGALSGTKGYAYGMTSLSRSGDYSKVGKANAEGVTNGKYADDDNKLSVLARYFGFSAQTDLSSAISVVLTGSEYDMRGYGNAFRSLSGAFENSPVFKIAYFGGEGKKTTISVDMDMPKYAVLNPTATLSADDVCDKDAVLYFGLMGRTGSDITVENVKLSGSIRSVCISPTDNSVYDLNKLPYKSDGKMYEYSTGGFIGFAEKASVFNKVSLESLNVISAGFAGGFIGYNKSGNITVNGSDASTGEIVKSTRVLVKGQRSTGGLVGHIQSGSAVINGFALENSTVEAIVRANEFEKTISVGGVVGAISSSAQLTMNRCSVKTTAVVFYSNYKATHEKCNAGGLLGLADTKKDVVNVNAESCTVDGCVIFALSNFGGNNFPYEGFVGDENSLSDDLKDNLVYNGEKQKSHQIVAWFLAQDGSQQDYSIGSAGGFIGSARTDVKLTACTLTASSAPVAIAGLNGAAGLIGEQREAGNITVTDCSVKTEGHDMFILGSTRAAGILAYGSATTGTYNIGNFSITGTNANPVRIISVYYKGANDASGLVGEISVALNVTNCRVSYCILAGEKAAAIYTYVKSTVSVKNAHVDNNLIYSISKYTKTAGGLFGALSGNQKMNVEGAYLGKNKIISSGSTGTLAAQAQTLNAKYVILDENLVCDGKSASNFTFAAKSLGEIEYGLLYDSAALTFKTVGLIAGKNDGTANAYAVSCTLPSEITTQQKNFASGTGTGTVVYCAYGAQNHYAGYNGSYDGSNQTGKTPQQIAIEARNQGFNIDGTEQTLYGDSITEGTPAKIIGLMSDLPEDKIIGGLKGWPNKDIEKYGTSVEISTLKDKYAAASVNGNLQLVCLSESADKTMKNYLDALTGGGFSSVTELNDDGMLSIFSVRYKVEDDGTLTALTGNGSIYYESKKFKVGVYDNLEDESNRTLTVLTITFKQKSGSAYSDVYTMHVAVYYHRSVDMKTYVVPVEGELYYLPTFVSMSVNEFGTNAVNVSFRSPFTLYVEYDYNDVAMKLEVENMVNFDKRIELTPLSGSSDEKKSFDKDTMFVLIDLNSVAPSGYSYYTLKLDKAQSFINFKDFKGFSVVGLHDIRNIEENNPPDRVCQGSEFAYTERYLLVVFPVNGSESKTTYYMKAAIDEEQRKKNNISVKLKNNSIGQISVWSAPTTTISSEYTADTPEGKPFSNLENEIVEMTVSTNITYPEGYVGVLQSQGGAVYETHILQFKDANNKNVTLPTKTKVIVTKTSGEPVFETELDAAASQVRFSLGNVLTAPDKKYTVKFDFSLVNSVEFYTAFTGSPSHQYTLIDYAYLSGVEGALGNAPVYTSKTFNVKKVDQVKLAVVPASNRYLGINLSNDDDETNSGIIDFTVGIRFDSVDGKIFNEAQIAFSVKKKVYDANANKYTYVELKAEEAGIWSVTKNGAVVSGDTITVDENGEGIGRYTLIVNKSDPYLELTNYIFTVSLTATSDDGETAIANDHFVFLICKIETEPGLDN